MAKFQLTRANMPLDENGNPYRPVLVTQVDSTGAIIGSASAVGSSLVSIIDSFNSVQCSITSVGGDALSNSNHQLFTASCTYGFNGTTFDRMRGDANGLAVQSALSSAFWNYAAASGGIVNTVTAVTVKAAAGAGVRNYIMSLQISHDALGAATEFAIRDGASGTVLWRGRLQTAAVDSSGTTINFDPPLKGSANTLVEIVTLTAVTGGVYGNLQGYTGI